MAGKLYSGRETCVPQKEFDYSDNSSHHLWGLASWRPDQAPSDGVPCSTAPFKDCCKTSGCGSLTPALMAIGIAIQIYGSRVPLFCARNGGGGWWITTVCNTDHCWEQQVSVPPCYCAYPISLLRRWHFRSLTFSPPKMFVYMSCTVQSMGSARMFFVPRKVKQRVHQTVSPFPPPRKNQQLGRERTRLERDFSPTLAAVWRTELLLNELLLLWSAGVPIFLSCPRQQSLFPLEMLLIHWAGFFGFLLSRGWVARFHLQLSDDQNVSQIQWKMGLVLQNVSSWSWSTRRKQWSSARGSVELKDREVEKNPKPICIVT